MEKIEILKFGDELWDRVIEYAEPAHGERDRYWLAK